MDSRYKMPVTEEHGMELGVRNARGEKGAGEVQRELTAREVREELATVR